MKKGFTLIELVISLGILLTFSVSFFAFNKAGMDFINLSQKRFEVLYLCQAKMESLRSLSFEKLPAENGKSFDTGRGLVRVITLSPDLLDVSIEHLWHKDRPKLIFYTLRSPY